MKALVTGGGGFLGSVIVRMLRERGDEVVSFSRAEHLPRSRHQTAGGDRIAKRCL
jgi:nucleoside-diphosphate-sugar epimerase